MLVHPLEERLPGDDVILTIFRHVPDYVVS